MIWQSLLKMNSEESYNSINQPQNQQQIFLNKYRIEAHKALKAINYKRPENRALLAQSFRTVNKLLDKIEANNFNLHNNYQNKIQQLVKSSYFYAPYDLGNYEFKLYSSICRQANKGSRKCQEPLIKIDGEEIIFGQKTEVIIVKEKQFVLSIQSEPYSVIAFTNQPKAHPLLIFPTPEQEANGIFKRIIPNNKFSQVFNPPCELSIVVIKEPYKIQSKLQRIKAISNQGEEINNRRLQMGWAIRPQQSFNFEDSSSGNQFSYLKNQKYAK